MKQTKIHNIEPFGLDALSDVDVATTAPTNGQALVFDDASDIWKPGSVASGGGSSSGGTPAGVKVTRTAAYDLVNAAVTALPWDTEVWDTHGFHDNVTNPARLTIPTGQDGRYMVSAAIGTDISSSYTRFFVTLRKNGTTIPGGNIEYSSSQYPTGQVSAEVDLVAGDYVDVVYYQNSGAARSMYETVSAFSMHKIVNAVTPPTIPADVWHWVGETGEPAYQNGWVPYNSAGAVDYYYGAGFIKIGNVVHLRGLIKNPADVGSSIIFTLPEGYRPLPYLGNKHLLFSVIAGGTLGRIDIWDDGRVQYVQNTSGTETFVELDGLSFAIDGVAIGGGEGSIKDRRWTVGSTETSIDEFNDDALDPAWVQVDGTGAPAANVSWVEGADVLSVKNNGGDASIGLHGMMRPLATIGGAPAVGDSFMTCFEIMSNPTANYAMAGLVLSDGVTHGAGLQVVSLSYWSSASHFQANDVRLLANWNSETTVATSVSSAEGPPTHVRLVKLAADAWRTDVSPNGIHWLSSATVTRAFTPTHIGVLSSSWGTANKHVVSYEFLRRTSGVT